MTEQEQKVIDKLIEAWNEFMKLPPVHPDDANDFRYHLHSLQRVIFSRQVVSRYNTPYVNYTIPNQPPAPNNTRQFANINTSQDV